MAGTAPVRRKKRHYRNEATRPPFDIECELTVDGEEPEPEGHVVECITFRDFQKLEAQDGFSFITLAQRDPEEALKMLLGDQWDRFWTTEGWRKEPYESVQDLMNDVIEHYSGATRGNS